jgi:hypothetical protein
MPEEVASVLMHEIEQLRQAVRSRDVIGQAKGVLRVVLRCDGDRAFRLLAQASQDTNRKLRDVAELVVGSLDRDAVLPADVRASLARHDGKRSKREPANDARAPGAGRAAEEVTLSG